MKSSGCGAPTASVACAGHSPGPRPVPGRRPWLRVPKLLLVLLMLIDTVAPKALHHGPADLERMGQSPSEKLCQQGHYLSSGSGDCRPCLDGVGYTSSANSLPSCLKCSSCKEDKEVKTRCNATQNTECQCKPGTFEDENSTEFCRNCLVYDTGALESYKPVGGGREPQKTQASLCTNDEDEETPCTPKKDRKCVRKDPASNRLALGLSIGLTLGLVFSVISAVVLWKSGKWRLLLLLINCCKRYFESANTVQEESLMEVQTPSVGNESHNNEVSLVVMAPEVVTLEPEEAEPSPAGRKLLLVPKNGTCSFDEFRIIFNQCTNIVPFDSWDRVMRQMDLTDNDIQVVRAETPILREVLYQMLLKWLQRTGRSASLNTLLDALEAVGERYARDTIEDYALKSGKFVYQEATEPAGLVTQ